MSKLTVTIVDYGLGNLLSLSRAFEFIGCDVVITRDHKTILDSSHLILPGVGSFPVAMESINKLDLKKILLEVADRGTPLLGICLGMQLLMTKSEEFKITEGLNLISGDVKKIKKSSDKNIKIPHIGWNTLESSNSSEDKLKILIGTNKKDSYYFVHSYTPIPNNKENRIFDTIYENVALSAIIKKKNIIGFQFHPEKSGKSGLQLLKNFLEI